jgi:hypothetical protein
MVVEKVGSLLSDFSGTDNQAISSHENFPRVRFIQPILAFPSLPLDFSYKKDD